ncbi:alpha/beta fold hydrolase [Frankia sp. AgB1.9]|uniref:alpha/beta hydrolase family protein n=1 Tax=Frankia sp. AgB1.9 TaxID=1836968 RepID=UPI001933CF36|nr:alpha/beta fold hydrolase [Frankia sp. AgB1.9]MBL7549264.1 alpha/beta fold hydrolase [Frankia sp. AgB1.9]
MSWFVDDADVATTAAVCRSRAIGAGVDPFRYDSLTAGLATLRDWLPAFVAAAEQDAGTAEAAERARRPATARQAWRAAAAAAHLAHTLPNPDLKAAVAADRQAVDALRRYAALWGPVHDLAPGTDGPRFEGELRLPAGNVNGLAAGTVNGLPAGTANALPPVAVIVPGLDSGRAEFLDLADALLDRGVAVAAIDGPGQGALADEPPQPAYEQVTSAVIDRLTAGGVIDPARVVLIGLSLGGLYAMRSAAADPRIRAVATVSGPYPMPAWDTLPPFAVDTLTIRCGSADHAQGVVAALAQPGLLAAIHQPLLVVSGGADELPSPAQARHIATTAPAGELLLVPDGDHLLGNTRWQWLDRTADWLAEQARTGR